MAMIVAGAVFIAFLLGMQCGTADEGNRIAAECMTNERTHVSGISMECTNFSVHDKSGYDLYMKYKGQK